LNSLTVLGNALTPDAAGNTPNSTNQGTGTGNVSGAGGGGVYDYQRMLNAQRMEAGTAPTNQTNQTTIKHTVMKASRELYLVRPFTIGAEAEGPAADFIGEFMGIRGEARRVEMFRKCKSMIEKHVNNHRNNAMGSVKKLAKGTYENVSRKLIRKMKQITNMSFLTIETELIKENKPIPNIEEVLGVLRSNDDNVYINFLELVGPCVMGIKLWKRGFKDGLKLSEIMGVPMEAFALLIYENHYESIKDPERKGKYTRSGTGWDTSGIERYMELLDIVEKSREESGDVFDETYKNFLSESGGGTASIHHVSISKDMVSKMDRYFPKAKKKQALENVTNYEEM